MEAELRSQWDLERMEDKRREDEERDKERGESFERGRAARELELDASVG